MGGGSWLREGNKRWTRLDIARRGSNETGKLAIALRSVGFCEATPFDLVDESKVSLYGGETGRDLRSACDASGYFYLFSPNEQRGGWGECAARLFILSSFPSSADHERDWQLCKVVFSGCNQYVECEKQQQQQQQQQQQPSQ